MTENYKTDQNFDNLLTFLKTSRGFDFSGYKRTSLSRRINKRMQMVGIPRYGDYVDYLNVHPEELTELFNTILINVTGFFRDPFVWDFIRDTALPEILENNPEGPIRIWSVGCASGEEPYSLAMLLAEQIGIQRYNTRVKIYATDLDDEALNRARAAIYTARDVSDIPPDLVEKYFERNGVSYQFNKELRRMVIYGKHNIINDAPISRIDLLLCRNLLMYLNNETQTQALSRLHFALKESGFLVLGKAEMLLAYSGLFAPVDLRARIFRPSKRPSYRDRLQMIASGPGEERSALIAAQMQLQEAAFMTNPTPQLVVDKAGLIAIVNDSAQRQFSLAPTDIGRLFQDLQISYRPVELRGLIEKCYDEGNVVTLKHVAWKSLANEQRFMDISINPLRNNGSGLIGVLISFNDTSDLVRLSDTLEVANRELETAMAELQSANEELETTNEELQSTIEELETTNEELQSSNEEMETMNEELQSTNEELETISEDAQNRTEDLVRANYLLDSILRSLRGGMIVADREGRILKWNDKSEDLWGLRSEEMLQHVFFDLDIGLPVAEIMPAVLEVVVGSKPEANLTVPAINRRGKAITCQVKILPLKNEDHAVHGFILLLDDQPA